jgi:hypothetical protein
VNIAGVATPLALVVAVVTFLPVSANVPLAPVDGAVNVTTVPLTADPLAVTVAASGVPNAPSTAWLCGVPLVEAIDCTGGTFPALFAGLGIAVVQLTSPRQTSASTAQPILPFVANPRFPRFCCWQIFVPSPASNLFIIVPRPSEFEESASWITEP